MAIPVAGKSMDQQIETFLEQFLRRLLRHSRLRGVERRAILALPGQVERVRIRQSLNELGLPTNHCILAGDGLLGRFEYLRSGRRQITAIYLPGDMCDLHAVVAPSSGAGVTSLSSANIVRIEHSALRRLAEEYSGIALAFWRDMALNTSMLAKGLAVVGHMSSSSRLAHLICELGIRYERIGQGNRTSFSIGISQEQIGDFLGISGVHINRTFMEIERLGLIARNRRNIDVTDWRGLADIAEFNPTYLMEGHVD